MFSRLIFSIVDCGARKELSAPLAPGPDNDGEPSAKQRARRTDVRGEPTRIGIFGVTVTFL